MEVRDIIFGIKSVCIVIDWNLYLYILDVNIVRINYKMFILRCVLLIEFLYSVYKYC